MPLIIMLIIFVGFVSVSNIYRQHKRQNNKKTGFESKTQYIRHLNQKESALGNKMTDENYLTRLNSKQDYREVIDKQTNDTRQMINEKDYSDWGE